MRVSPGVIVKVTSDAIERKIIYREMIKLEQMSGNFFATFTYLVQFYQPKL